jgi:hypothetical protein
MAEALLKSILTILIVISSPLSTNFSHFEHLLFAWSGSKGIDDWQSVHTVSQKRR